MKREVRYFLYKSPIGILPIAYSEDGVFFLELKSKLEPFIEYLQARGLNPVEAEEPPRRLVEELDSYFSGRRVEFSFPVVFLWGTGFQRAVWNAIREIPYGETRSYAWLANRVGRPKAYRAVGNAVGVAKVPEMLRLGVKVGLGNDGYIFDAFENIRAVYLLHKVHSRDPRILTPKEVLEMATIRGAELYGLEKELGSLEPGKLADIIVIRPDVLPTPLDSRTVYGHLVNTVDGDDVQTVLVGGEVIMRDRRVLTVDEASVLETAQKAASKLWQRLEQVEPQVDRLSS